MTAYVIIKSDYDYDSPSCDRLISCATFSSHEKAVAYVRSKLDSLTESGEIVTVEDGDDEWYGYDEDETNVVRFTIIETEIDEFEIK